MRFRFLFHAGAWLFACLAVRAQSLNYLAALGDVGNPTGVSVDVLGGVTYLYVSDHNGGRVFKYNLADGTRTQIGFPGRGPGQFVWPDAIAIDPATHDLYIPDRQLHRVVRLKNTGEFVMQWGGDGPDTNRFGFPGAGTAPGQFNEPVGAIVDAAGNLYVSEHENHRVQKFRVTQVNGAWNVEVLKIWGSGGSAPGQFNTPYCVTLDPAGNVWVADGYNSRVQKFTPNGDLLGEVVVRGAGEPQVIVTWIAFDAAGDFYVSVTSDPSTGGEIQNQRVQKFSAGGASLAKWGTYGSEPGNFKLPFGIAFDRATHRAYLADWDNGRVQVFDVGATAAPAKVSGAATEVASDIRHPNGNVYDQVLLSGAAATVTADPGQVTRVSYEDLNHDLVQVEFSGAGSLSVTLENASGPAPAQNYNQPGVSYMRGHASLAIRDANETTNVSIFSVGRANAIDQSIFRGDATYDGWADLASLTIASANGKFGGVRAGNANFSGTHDSVGVVAPGLQFTGPVVLGDVAASDAAQPAILLGGVSDARIAGGDMAQPNARAIQVSGIAQLRFTAGASAQGATIAAQKNAGRFEENGVDVTSRIVSGP